MYNPSKIYLIERANQLNTFKLYDIIKQQVIKLLSCNFYLKSQNRLQFSILIKILEEIQAVPLYRRKFLSSIYLYYSLERNSRSNFSYSKY